MGTASRPWDGSVEDSRIVAKHAELQPEPNNSQSFRLNLRKRSGAECVCSKGANGGDCYLLEPRSLLVLPNYREDALIRYPATERDVAGTLRL